MDQTAAKKKTRVLSGVQPSGEAHLGNYLGAFRQWVHMQDEYECLFTIVDQHAIVGDADPAELPRLTFDMAVSLLAVGLDPERCTIFVQSDVIEHMELAWLFNAVAPLGELKRMTQYKDKAAKQDSVSVGLLDYPVLMAADIILYDAHEVPVGDDQKQHVELARDIAQRFNHIYGETFVVPEPVIPEVGARVMGLNDPTVKMSKTFSNVRGHAVGVLDPPEEIERTIRRAVTDSGNEIYFSDDPRKAGVNNLLGIYKVVTGKELSQVEADFADARGYGDLKKRVAEVVIEELTPIRERYETLMSDVAELDRFLARGAEQARQVSGPKLEEVKRRVGLVLPGGS